ncbi:MAG: RHS repeat-associated core domain-containing protein, partial [Anaerolineales bacterium]|nr:RHS repeat-associated core domain-containing protein [Anaerolineales bacterium]
KYAIPRSMSVEYFLGDHLGSTSITTDANGAKVSEMRYKPWGEIRYSWTASQSTTPAYLLPNYTFTGQFSHMDDPSTAGVTEGFGLMFYNARWMDPALGRFAQADTIIPPGTQGLDRYAYANNSPVMYIDPSGHTTMCGASCEAEDNWSLPFVDSQYGITFTGGWSASNKKVVRTAVQDVATALLIAYNQSCGWTENCVLDSAAGFFNTVYEGVEFAWVSSYTDAKGNIYTAGATTKNSHRIEFASLPVSYSDSGGYKTPEMAFREGVNNVVHELGHAFGQKWYRKNNEGYDPSGPYVNIPDGLISNDGFYPSPADAPLTWRQHPCTGGYDCPSEVFADMFLGWTYNMWASDLKGVQRQIFMDQRMMPWIVNLVSP